MRALLSTASVDIRRYFLSAVIDCQPKRTIELLIALSGFEVVHPDLCVAITGDKELEKELLRLHEETPLISRAEGGEWMKLHPLAREGLRARWNELPLATRQDNARKASAWYAVHDMYDAAAEQSFLSGDIEAAITLAEQHSSDMTIQGRNAAVLAWYDRLSPRRIATTPRILVCRCLGPRNERSERRREAAPWPYPGNIKSVRRAPLRNCDYHVDGRRIRRSST